jgi:uroporphyrin-III C-methyltransferase/precorrin-2 dehydrogenase/sirohydrochlorin ferrochelatase
MSFLGGGFEGAGPFPPIPGARPLVSLVGAGPGSADLITLRGARRIAEADLVLYDRLVDPELLALARPEADKVFVGKTPGAACAQQARIDAMLVAAARAGRRVVRLKSGDPGVFARAAEEIAALAAAGFAVEIVPGVTAASAAAAEAGRPLTDRAGARTVVFASAHPADDAPPVAWAAIAATGGTLAIYMGVARAAETARALIAGGAAPDSAVEIVERAGSADVRRTGTTLAALAEAIRRRGVRNPALLLVYPPQPASPVAATIVAAQRAPS